MNPLSKSGLKSKIIRVLYSEFLSYEYSPEKYKEFQSKLWDRESKNEWSGRGVYDFSSFEKLITMSTKSVADLGCGNGHNLSVLQQKFPHIKTYGIDASAKMIELASKNSPSTKFYKGFYGPDSDTFLPIIDAIFIRSSLTYIDEYDIANVLNWIFSKAEDYVIISDPSGKNDIKDNVHIKVLNNKTYLRKKGDQTHIRNYELYIQELDLPFTLKEEFIDANGGNYNWVFQRNKVK